MVFPCGTILLRSIICGAYFFIASSNNINVFGISSKIVWPTFLIIITSIFIGLVMQLDNALNKIFNEYESDEFKHILTYSIA